MLRSQLQGVLTVVILVSAIMFALVALQAAQMFVQPPAPAFPPDVPVASTSWLPGRTHVVVLSSATEPNGSLPLAGESL